MPTTNIIMSTMVQIVSTVHTSHVNYGTYRVNYTYKPCQLCYTLCQLHVQAMSTIHRDHVNNNYKSCHLHVQAMSTTIRVVF